METLPSDLVVKILKCTDLQTRQSFRKCNKELYQTKEYTLHWKYEFQELCYLYPTFKRGHASFMDHKIKVMHILHSILKKKYTLSSFERRTLLRVNVHISKELKKKRIDEAALESLYALKKPLEQKTSHMDIITESGLFREYFKEIENVKVQKEYMRMKDIERIFIFLLDEIWNIPYIRLNKGIGFSLNQAETFYVKYCQLHSFKHRTILSQCKSPHWVESISTRRRGLPSLQSITLPYKNNEHVCESVRDHPELGQWVTVVSDDSGEMSEIKLFFQNTAQHGMMCVRLCE